jgi:hypothetical protein
VLKESQTTKSAEEVLYRAEPGGLVDRESLRNNLASIAESLRDLSEAINNHAIDLESMMPGVAAHDGKEVRP